MEQYIAPVKMNVKYSVKKFNDKWSYQIKMDFNFDHHSEEIKDEILTELGVYVFKNENEAKVQAKRTAKAMESYFREKLPDVIADALGDDW